MKNEADFKTIWKKSVRQHGGHTITIAAPMFAGVPDLYCILPGYLPVLLEAKWLGVVTKENFKRKIPFTELQKRWIRDCHNVVNYSAMGLIGFNYQGRNVANLVPYGLDMFETFTDNFRYEIAHSYLTEKRFDVMSMFASVPIPRIMGEEKDASGITGFDIGAITPKFSDRAEIGLIGNRSTTYGDILTGEMHTIAIPGCTLAV